MVELNLSVLKFTSAEQKNNSGQEWAAFRVELQSILKLLAGQVIDDHKSRQIGTELTTALMRLHLDINCHHCGEPAKLRFMRPGNYKESHWRFSHRGGTTHRATPDGGNEKAESNLFPINLELTEFIK